MKTTLSGFGTLTGFSKCDAMHTRAFKTTIVLCLSLFVFLGIGNITPARAETLLDIIEIVWTDGITEEKNPLNIYRNDGSAPVDQPLFLWIKVRGRQEAFDRLKQKGRLTIQHKWTYNNLGWQTDRIDVSIGRDPVIDDMTLMKLEQELAAKGYFDWRTWSKKERLVPGEYSVTCVDGFDQPLRCSQDESCQMSIQLIQ